MDFPPAHLMASVALAAYLIGSVPFGIIIARIMGLGDLRKIGSGNIGATNVLRTGSKTAAALTLLFDGGKGAGAVVAVAAMFSGNDTILLTAIAAVMAVIGHCYPVWLGFKGGKGVATGIGVVAAMDIRAGLVMGAVWLAVAAIGRISSLSALIAYAVAPLALLFFSAGGAVHALGGGLIALLSWWRHRANIARIIAGNEPKIGA